MDGPDAEVVGAVRMRAVHLRRAVRRAADQRAGPGELARAGDRHVVLADVRAVGAGRDDEVGAVVEDEERARGGAELARDRGRGEQVVVRGVLLAQLEDVDAARERGPEDVGERPAGRAGAGDEVQPGAVEALAARGGRAHAGDSRNPASVRFGRVPLTDSPATCRGPKRRRRCAGPEAGRCSR